MCASVDWDLYVQTEYTLVTQSWMVTSVGGSRCHPRFLAWTLISNPLDALLEYRERLWRGFSS
jgi:hypothetical protein